MGRKPKLVHDKPAVEVECTHYWLIESATGPTSMGICKFCGAESEFRNYIPHRTSEDKVCKPREVPDLKHSKAAEERDRFAKS